MANRKSKMAVVIPGIPGNVELPKRCHSFNKPLNLTPFYFYWNSGNINCVQRELLFDLDFSLPSEVRLDVKGLPSHPVVLDVLIGVSYKFIVFYINNAALTYQFRLVER